MFTMLQTFIFGNIESFEIAPVVRTGELDANVSGKKGRAVIGRTWCLPTKKLSLQQTPITRTLRLLFEPFIQLKQQDMVRLRTPK